MCLCLKFVFFLNFIISSYIFAAPSASKTLSKKSGVNDSLEQFLSTYYDQFVRKSKKHVEVNIYDTMQGDQPAGENNVQNVDSASIKNGINSTLADAEYVRVMRDRLANSTLDERAKENWIQVLKENILRQMGRENATISKQNFEAPSASLDNMPSFLNTTNMINDDQITEKIRGFYPSCEIPINTDQDLWKNEDIMNLYFNYDYIPEDRNTNIATATLRLYRLPENGTKFDPKSLDCDLPGYNEDDRLLRISVYWYTKSLKKRRVKRRLSDSRVVAENAKWVELSVKPAAKAWSKGKNLGLAIVVEDQEGNTLKAEKYFKGASCMQLPNLSQLSSSTPPSEQMNLTKFLTYWEEIQRQPFIVIYTCYQ